MTTPKRDAHGGGRDDRTDADRAVALSALALAGERAGYGHCPDPERLVAWHERRLGADAAAGVERHVADCDRCFALWRELHALAASDPRRTPARAGEGAAAGAWWTRLLAGLRTPAGVGAATAVALALVVVIGLDLAGPGTGGGGAVAPIPGYELTLQGRADFRGDGVSSAAAPVVLTAGNRFELLLRPATAVEGEVAATVYAVDAAGAVRALPATPATLSRGLVLIRGTLGADWALPAGQVALLVAVGRPQALPDGETLRARLDGGDQRIATTITGPGFAAWRGPVIVEP